MARIRIRLDPEQAELLAYMMRKERHALVDEKIALRDAGKDFGEVRHRLGVLKRMGTEAKYAWQEYDIHSYEEEYPNGTDTTQDVHEIESGTVPGAPEGVPGPGA